MDKAQRWQKTLEMLSHRGVLDVASAAAELGVSSATVRRDLNELAEQQMLVRTRGGATGASVAYDLPLRYKTAQRATEKQRIASAVARIIWPGSVVGVNGGTTTTEVMRAVCARIEGTATGSAEHPLTVVTNALNIAAELVLWPRIKAVVTGGVARQASYELSGALARHTLNEVVLDVAIIGVGGVTVADGATTAHEEEASINRVMVGRASKVILVADSTKLMRRAFAVICPLASVNVLVTDSSADPEHVRALLDTGIEVIVA